MFVLLYKYVIFALFMLNINPFQANVLFPYPLKTSGLKWVIYLFLSGLCDIFFLSTIINLQ